MSDTKATLLAGQMDMFREPVMVPDLGEKVERIGRKPVGYYDAREPLTKATGFVDGYDYTANPYSGCTFSCAYCYAANFAVRRDAEMSWGSWVDVKQNFLEAFGGRHEAGSLDGKRIYMSSVTDPYQPVERTLELTRGVSQDACRASQAETRCADEGPACGSGCRPVGGDSRGGWSRAGERYCYGAARRFRREGSQDF